MVILKLLRTALCLYVLGLPLVKSSFSLKKLHPPKTVTVALQRCDVDDIITNNLLSVACDNDIDTDDIYKPHGSLCNATELNGGQTSITRYVCLNGVWNDAKSTGTDVAIHRRHKRWEFFAAVAVACYFLCGSGGGGGGGGGVVTKYPPEFDSDCPPGDLQNIYYTSSGSTSTIVSWRVPSATDRDGSVDSLRQSIGISRGGSFSGSPSGQQHAIAYEAKDNDGQTAFCYFSFTVQVRTCNRLSYLQNGNIHCPDDNILGSTCTYQCDEGYQLQGNSEVTCQNDNNPTWTAIPTCEKVSCGTPVEVANGEASCTDPDYVYNSFCSYTCDAGYDGYTLALCRADSSWLRMIDNACTDDAPPTIVCQSPQVFYADRASTSTSVTWILPEVTDLVDPSPSLTKTNGPDFGVSIEAGTSQYVTYQASDANGNVSPQCTIELRVLEISCGHPLDTLEDADLRFNCSMSTYTYGDTCHLDCALNLPLDGTALITCETDTTDSVEKTGYWDWGNGTMPFCRDIACPDLTPPQNGALVYDTTNTRPTATMMCNKKYDIPDVGSNFNGLFLCQDSGLWYPQITAAPGCIETFTSRGFRLAAEIFYYSGTCGIDDNIDQQFQLIVDDLNNLFSTLCPTDTSCSVNDPRIVCGPVSKRKKREIHWRYRRETDQDIKTANSEILSREKRETNVLQFNFNIETNFNFSGLSLSQLYTEVDDIQLSLLKPAIQIEFDNGAYTIDAWTLRNDSFQTDQYGLVYCDPGSVLDGPTLCKPCPVGYYENNDECTICPIGEYSDTPGSTNCTRCQDGFSTRTTGSVSLNNCTKLCDAGHYSPDTFAPCAQCKLGYYQEQSGQTTCTTCPASKTTLITGRTSESDCQYFDIMVNKTMGFANVLNISLLENMSVMLWSKVSGSGTPRATFLFGNVLEISIRDNILITTNPSGADSVESSAGPSSSSAWIHVAVTWDTTSNLLSVYYRGTVVVDQIPVTTTSSPLVQDGYLSVVADGDAAVMITGFRVTDSVINQADITAATQSCQDNDSSDVLHMGHLRVADTNGISVGTPSSCDAIDECQADPCNGHNCINEINSFTCTCSNGWSGTTCDTPPDHCISHECHTGSTCVNLDVDYECQCPSGYSGLRCDIPPVDGEWSSWSSWTDCPITCSNETRTRNRTCDNPPPDQYGQNCDGDSTQTELCNHDPCPECPELSRSFGHLVSCETSLETGTMACNYTCKDGYDLPNGLDFELYRCGLETDFTWEPRSTVPKCVGQQRSRGYEFVSTATYETTVSDQDGPNVVSSIEANTNGADCFNSAFCRRSVTLSNDGDTRKRRSTGTTVTVTFTIDINGTSDLMLEEFEANNTVSEGLQEILDALTYLDSTAQAINNSANTVFDVTVNGVTYLIDSSSLTFEGSTTCGETEVSTDGLCTECPDGTYKNGDFCAYCEKGTYQELSGQMSCTQCPSGYTTVSIGSSTAQQCSELENSTSTSNSFTPSTTPSTTSTPSTNMNSTESSTTTSKVQPSGLTSNPTQTTSTASDIDEDDDESIGNSMLIVIISSISGVISIVILAILVVVLVKKFCRPSKVSDSHANLRDYNHPRPTAPPMFPFWSPLPSTNGPSKPKLRKDESMIGQRDNTAISISDLEVGEIKAPTDIYRPSNTPSVTSQSLWHPYILITADSTSQT